MGALARKFANNESFFQQSIEATGGDGQVLLAPELPGDIQILEIGQRQFRIADGAFLVSRSANNCVLYQGGCGQKRHLYCPF